MRISRREFLKYCSIAAGALGLTTTDLLKIEDAFAKIGNGGPHVVWLPGQACTGCTMSLTNSIKETDVASLLLLDIDLDYNEQLNAAAGELAVEAAVSAIGKTTVLAIEGSIPSAATGGDAHFCTIWSRTGGILAAESEVFAAGSSPISPEANGRLITAIAPPATTLALQGGDVIGKGSELVAGTTLPTGSIFASAADRALISKPVSEGGLGILFNTDVASSYGTNRTNANIVINAVAGITVNGSVAGNSGIGITGGTDMGNSNGQTLTQGSVLAATTTLAVGTLASSSFDRLWLSELDTNGAPVNTNVIVTWTYAGPANEWSLTATAGAVINSSRAVSGPMILENGTIIALNSSLKTGTLVPDPTDQTNLIADSGIATLFDGYGGATGTVYSLASPLTLPGTALSEIFLQGDVTVAPLAVGILGSTPETDKTMLHECELFGTSAAAILCIGTCSSFGGIPAAAGNRTGASGALYKGLSKPGKYNGALKQFATKIINIGGCPPHSDWIVGTIAYILATNYQMPPTEAYGRPIDYFGQYQCNAGPCEWRFNQGYNAADEVNPPYANPKTDPVLNANIDSSLLYKNKWGNDPISNVRYTGCIGVLGCKGRKTKADCSLRRWNADATNGYGTNWCVGSGAGCHGCTEPTFPDKVGKFFNFA